MAILSKIITAFKHNKKLSVNLVGVIILKGIALALAFVMTPMYLGYFSNNDILGVWYTLQSILVWILTFDLGVGNGMRNRLAYAMAAHNDHDAKIIVSSGYVIMGGITIVIIILMASIIPNLDWQIILNTDINTKTLSLVLMITLIGISLQFFFKIVSSILMALRKNIVANALPVFTNILILLFLRIPYQSDDEGKFIALAFVYSIATILPLLISTIYIFMGPLKHIRPSFAYYQKQVGKDVLLVGGKFFSIQAGLLVINSTNQILINSLFGGSDVVIYSLYYRLFSMAAMIFTLFTQPVWSEISVHYAKKDMKWIRNIYFFMLGIVAVISIGCLCVTGLLPWIFKVWIGEAKAIDADRQIALIFTVWAIVEVFIAASTCIANGMTQLRCQMIFTIIAAVLKVPLTIVLAKTLSVWTSVVISHTLVLVPLLIAQNYSLFSQLVRKRAVQ